MGPLLTTQPFSIIRPVSGRLYTVTRDRSRNDRCWQRVKPAEQAFGRISRQKP
jgi:hypothetical protein